MDVICFVEWERAGEKTACDGVRGPGEVAGVERESESESSSLQCDDSEESESEVAGEDGGATVVISDETVVVAVR